MSRRTNIVNNAVTLIATVGLIFLSAYIANDNFSVNNIFTVLPYFLIGAVVAGLVNAFAHEFGHLLAGKNNGFAFISVTVWFFRWSKPKKRIRFDFVMIGEEAGYTEMLPVGCENLARRFGKMTSGGIIASAVMTLLSVVPLFFAGQMSMPIFCILSMFLPLSAYYFIGSALPMSSGGARNDGAVIAGLRKNDDVAKVTVNLLAIHGELYAGKTPAEIDEKLYFDLPQLPEDDINFTLLYNARYNYYLDKGDYENAKKISDRLMGISDDIPKSVQAVVKTDALYDACTFDFDEDVADDLMYELDKYLNRNNDVTAIRVKLAYIAFIRREKEQFDKFYDKGVKEANKHRIKGLGRYEKKLLDRIKDEYSK